jgi:hypothetical protein
MATKPKLNRKPGPMDNCQTPGYALDPLMHYIQRHWAVWEPAFGEGYLVKGLNDRGIEHFIMSDISESLDFFTYEPQLPWDCIITNPPYSMKVQWLERCYSFQKPFALLLPVETLGVSAAQNMFAAYGMQLILMNKRINFKMPRKGWTGSSAQFPTAWFTWGLLPQEVIYRPVMRYFSEDEKLPVCSSRLEDLRRSYEGRFDCSPMVGNCDHEVVGDMCRKCGYRW